MLSTGKEVDLDNLSDEEDSDILTDNKLGFDVLMMANPISMVRS